MNHQAWQWELDRAAEKDAAARSESSAIKARVRESLAELDRMGARIGAANPAPAAASDRVERVAQVAELDAADELTYRGGAAYAAALRDVIRLNPGAAAALGSSQLLNMAATVAKARAGGVGSVWAANLDAPKAWGFDLRQLIGGK